MSRWEGLDEFVAVAETGRFTAAAERLGLSSSHVSRQVARLEERLQTRLFCSTRRVALTEAGQTFLQHCQRLVDARDEALRAVNDLTGEPKGLLRMTCAVAYGERFIVPLVNQFMARHPQLRVEIELSNRPLDLVHEGLDLAIRLGRLQDSRLVATRLAPRVMYLCAAPPISSVTVAPQPLRARPAQLPDRQFGPMGLPRGGTGTDGAGAGQLAVQQRRGGAGCGAARRPVPAAGLLRAGAPAGRQAGLPAGTAPAAEYRGLGDLSTAAPPVTQGAPVGGSAEGRPGEAPGLSRSVPAGPALA